MKLSNQCQRIYDILKDGQFHCPQEWGFSDGHCKRITDLNRQLAFIGQEIRSEVCNCGRHQSKILMRRIADKQKVEVQPVIEYGFHAKV